MLAAKAGQKTLADVADRIHVMTYVGDEREAVTAWEQANLPLHRLAFGVRFYVDNGTPYLDLPDNEINGKPGLRERQRVRDASLFAYKKRLAGVFIWEIGQDTSPTKKNSLLKALHSATKEAEGNAEL
eukprot:TRINITY_DN78494_c0_g1_i1.p1 TRINITY_DN78494_c0_g1~~TRINITY_DN78494_c0_g1_i1.p1  ORF type:complete len:140 (+),score=26.43 TRINITY_DN78494_c0_g1_i1:37-420(+)